MIPLSPKYQAILDHVTALKREMEEDTAEKRHTPPGTGLAAVLVDKRSKGYLDTSAAVLALCYLLRADELLGLYEEYIKELIFMVTERPDQITDLQRRMIEAAFDDAGGMQKPIKELRRMFRNKMRMLHNKT